MEKDGPPIHERVSARLRQVDLVRDSLARLASQGKVWVNDVSALALDTTSPVELRLDAIVALLSTEEGDEVLLRKLLASDDRMIIIETLKFIRRLGTDWVIPELVAQVETCGDVSKRAVTAWSLAAYPENSGVQGVLLNVMARDTDLGVREHAIESLSEFRSRTVINALLRVLERGSPGERFWALYSLGTIGDPATAEAIAQHLGDETAIPEFGTIADEAHWALAKIRGSQGTPSEPNPG